MNRFERKLKEGKEFLSELQKIAEADLMRKAQNSTFDFSKAAKELMEPVLVCALMIGVGFLGLLVASILLGAPRWFPPLWT